MDSANVGYSYQLPSGGWNNKIRNTLSQFSDLFSEFNKYIAPAYHHDRCERSVPMRVYTMHKGEFVMVIVAFLAVFGLGVFIGLAGPCPTITTTVAASSTVTNKSDIYRGVLHLHSPALGLRFQQLWLTAQIMTNNDDEEIFDKSFQISISINGVLNDHTLTTLVPASEATNKTRHLKCKDQVCKPVLVLHLGSLEFVHYVLNIQMHGLQEFHKRYFISEIFFYFKTYNPGFTQMETWFRFIFLLTTFIVTCWFAHTLKKYSSQDWAIEQKWLSMLLPLLLLFNDPIFPLRLVSAGFFAPLIDSIFQTTFLCGVMLSWLALYHGIRQNERSFLTFYLFKVLVVGGVWLPAVVVASWQRYDAFYDPTYDYTENYNYPLVRLLFFCALAFYFLYLLVLIVKAYSDLRNMPFFEVRLRCLSLSAGSVVLLAAWLAALRWGPAALQDHWVSQPDSHYVTSAPFMALYGLFNFNMYFLAYLYSPAGGSIQDTAITKDNPAFSMINDSDEEVLYGSDEDSRRPLNAHRTVASEEI